MWSRIRECGMEKRIAASMLFLQPYRYVDRVGFIVQLLSIVNVGRGEDTLKLRVDVVCDEESSNCSFVEDGSGRYLPFGKDGCSQVVGDVLNCELAHGVDRTRLCGHVVAYQAFEAIEAWGGMDACLHVSVVVVL